MLAGLRLYAAIGIGLVIAALLAWGLRLDHLRGYYKAGLEHLAAEANGVVTAARVAADNPELGWEAVPGQVIALGEDRRELRRAIASQNQAIDEMAREAIRLRAEAARLREIADQAKAQREAALRRLSDLSITPGTREDCMQLLREAEEALDLVYEAGL